MSLDQAASAFGTSGGSPVIFLLATLSSHRCLVPYTALRNPERAREGLGTSTLSLRETHLTGLVFSLRSRPVGGCGAIDGLMTSRQIGAVFVCAERKGNW